MLDQTFGRVYTKFKLHFYKQIFSRFEDREATLTTVESFCMEVIMALGEPTIAQFSHMMNLSTPNAALWLSVLLTYTSLLFSSDMGNGVYGLVSIFKVHIYTIIISYPRRKHKFYDFLETFERRISLISRTAAGFSLPAYRTVTLHPST